MSKQSCLNVFTCNGHIFSMAGFFSPSLYGTSTPTLALIHGTSTPTLALIHCHFRAGTRVGDQDSQLSFQELLWMNLSEVSLTLRPVATFPPPAFRNIRSSRRQEGYVFCSGTASWCEKHTKIKNGYDFRIVANTGCHITVPSLVLLGNCWF